MSRTKSTCLPLRRDVCLALVASVVGPAGCHAIGLRLHSDAGPPSSSGAADCQPPVDEWATTYFFNRPWCRGHVGNPPHPNKSHVKVLAFGDSWAEMGPSHGMLQDMFAKHGVNARVELVGRSGSQACEWANDTESLVNALDHAFGGEKVDYVWFSLGGNDIGRRDYTDCIMAAEAMADRHECQQKFVADTFNPCSDSMLTAMWETERYSSVRVVQCGYDFFCEHQACQWLRGVEGFPQLPECETRGECRRMMQVVWQDYLLDKKYHNFRGHGDKYTGISILGALQSTDPEFKGSAGKPNLKMGSPCDQTILCNHPRIGTAGTVAIGEAFWDMYFKDESLVKYLQILNGVESETGE